jgi:hypothetical protein
MELAGKLTPQKPRTHRFLGAGGSLTYSVCRKLTKSCICCEVKFI